MRVEDKIWVKEMYMREHDVTEEQWEIEYPHDAEHVLIWFTQKQIQDTQLGEIGVTSRKEGDTTK